MKKIAKTSLYYKKKYKIQSIIILWSTYTEVLYNIHNNNDLFSVHVSNF